MLTFKKINHCLIELFMYRWLAAQRRGRTMHSTDTHGFTEVNFAVTYLIQVAYAPRIQSFQDQQLYAFAGTAVPDLAAYVRRSGLCIAVS